MMKNIRDLQKLFQKGLIEVRKKAFNDQFSQYKFDLILSNDDFTDEIRDRLITSKIIIIDEIEENNERYYVICIYHEVMVISINNFHFLYLLFIDHNPTFFTSSKETYDHISNQIRSNTDDTTNFLNKFNYSEINKYKDEIQVLINSIDLISEKQILEWKMIQKSISSYLIIFSHQKLKIDRISNFQNFFKEENKAIEMNNVDIEALKQLGVSCNSNIFLIYNIKLEYLFILKMQKGDEKNNLFEREMNNYNNLHHPFLLKFYGKTNYEFDDYMILEYMEGHMLIDIEGKIIHLNQSEKIKILFQLMIVLEYIHNHNYVYRDLKPNNIILNYANVPILIDLDRMVQNVEYLKGKDSTTDFGHKYIAPEICTSGKFSLKSDIYSLGMIVYFLILEKHPKFDKFNENIFIDFPKESIEFKKLFEDCIKIDPNQRPGLSQLINDFYFNFFAKIPPLISEANNIKSIQDIHSLTYSKYWVLISEPNRFYKPIDIFLLKLERKILPDDINIAINYFHEEKSNLQCNDLYYLAFAADPDCLKLMMYLGNYYFMGDSRQINIEKAIYYYTQAAIKGDSVASLNLGSIYINEIYGHQDINKAIDYFTLSSKQNNSYAQYELANMYLTGMYVKKNINTAIMYLTLSAKGGHVISQHTLGIMYYFGQNVDRNIYESIRYYSLASEQNHANSQHNLGNIFYWGQYINKDIEKAIYYYTLAAQNGIVESQYNLGIIYYTNLDKPRDIKKAIYYFTLATINNHSNAPCILGVIFFEGKYIARDVDKAIFYYKIAAQKNNLNALYNLGTLYFYGHGVPKDVYKGIEYLTLSANKNDISSNIMLGYIYYTGMNVQQDKAKSKIYFEKAANLNSKEAQYTLGTLLYDEDINKSIYYLTLSAQNNYVYAQYNLGLVYIYGQKVKKDINKSIYYFSCAANQNFVFAQYNLGIIYQSNYFIKRDINKSINYFTKAAKQNFSKAQYNLGCIYWYGQFIKRDINLSIYYFTLAAYQNMPEAQFNLGYIYFFSEPDLKDIQKAINFFKQAAENGFLPAFHNLGYIYFQLKLYDKAIYYYNCAAEKNDNESQFTLGCIYYKGIQNIVKKDMKMAVKYYTDSADQHNKNAHIALGILYYKGEYVQQNINKSIYYFKFLADENKNKYALYFLGYIYYEGNNIQQNIERSIHYYKESSNLKNYYAKNNLAIIYKNGFGVKKNVQYAEELLLEVYKLDANEISIYNLCHLYLFKKEKNCLDECIDLLLSNNIGKLSLNLLCLAFIEKYNQITLKIINDEIKSHSKMNKIQPNLIFEEINRRKLMNSKNYNAFYNYIHDIDFMFDFDQNIIKSFFNNSNSSKNNVKYNVSSDFYDGFDIYS